MSKSTTSKPDLPEAAIYEIRLQGHLDARWADRLGVVGLGHDTDGTTVLRAAIADQSALHGLLKRIRDLGIPLISVVPLALERTSTINKPSRKDVK